MDYSQPINYHFSSDSICLSSYIFSIYKHRSNDPIKMLEIGTGCGVIALELKLKLPRTQLTLFEMQSIFLVHILKNIDSTLGLPCPDINIFIEDFCERQLNDKFEVVFANLPYFYLDESRSSNDHIKNNCKIITKEKLNSILNHSLQCLDHNGHLILIFNTKSGKSAYHDACQLLKSYKGQVNLITRDTFIIIDYWHTEYAN